MSKAQRFSIVGATGSGKSYLARELARRLSLPLHELDVLNWDEKGEQVPQANFVEAVCALVATDEWVIDGHYRDVRHLIWSRADTVVWLNYSPAIILVRLARRFGRKVLDRKSRESGLAP